MLSLLSRYTHWLHTRWPAGKTEPLPLCNPDGSTRIPNVYIVGDLTGIPLLKFAGDSGARAVRTLAPRLRNSQGTDRIDLAIIGGGVAGISGAIEAHKLGLAFRVFESSRPFSTIEDFPKGKPIYTYPSEMKTEGLQFTATVKESLLEELERQRREAGIECETLRIEKIARSQNGIEVIHEHGTIRAQAVLIAIGRSGNYRKIGAKGEDSQKVYNRLHDPKDFAKKRVLVVGGGDSALEAAIALKQAGADVEISYRKSEFSRPKAENQALLRALQIPVHWKSTVREILPDRVGLETEKGPLDLPNDVVFALIGREAPLDFFRRSGLPIRGEKNLAFFAGLSLFLSCSVFVYLWKGGTALNRLFQNRNWFPFNLAHHFGNDPHTLGGTLEFTFVDPGFYYALAYTFAILFFGFRRIRRRQTPYVKRQTLTLMTFQLVPLFLLPYILLPLLGMWGVFDAGLGKLFADAFFPQVDYGYGREYWRAFGFILAWPLFLANVFTGKPLWTWLIVSLLQTFVLIPLLVRRWGKGAYCGWICSCGALAETMGDTQREKMPHGPGWNRLNMLGQFLLGVCFFLFAARVLSWVNPGGALGGASTKFFEGLYHGWFLFGIPLNYYFLVDIGMAGIVGVGLYFHFSGRVWCRFACPLAALMHIYARFTQFRIFAEKKKCISCNVCTSVCHQGIDIMNFANKGLPMVDPECVRCSACVQSCPTGVLSFGRITKSGTEIRDRLQASHVRARES